MELGALSTVDEPWPTMSHVISSLVLGDPCPTWSHAIPRLVVDNSNGREATVSVEAMDYHRSYI